MQNLILMDYSHQDEVSIPVGKVILKGDLNIPVKAKGIIIFSHGSGSSRFSTRNRQVAKYLQEKSFGTLLLDLLTPSEDKVYLNRFDIELADCEALRSYRMAGRNACGKELQCRIFRGQHRSRFSIESSFKIPGN